MHTFLQQTPAGVAEYTGVLLHRAEARVKQIDADGHYASVLCFDVQLDNDLHTHLHAEQRFLCERHSQAEAAAHRLTKGTRVTIQAPLAGLRIVASNTTHIHIHKQERPLCPTE